MRLLALRLSAYVAIAGIICLSSTFARDTAGENNMVLPEVDVEAAVSDRNLEVLIET